MNAQVTAPGQDHHPKSYVTHSVSTAQETGAQHLQQEPTPTAGASSFASSDNINASANGDSLDPARPSLSSEVLPLAEFLARSVSPPQSEQESHGSKYISTSGLGPPSYQQGQQQQQQQEQQQEQEQDEQRGNNSNRRRYSPPPTPPIPAQMLSNQIGRIPITSATGEFTGFQHYSSYTKDSFALQEESGLREDEHIPTLVLPTTAVTPSAGRRTPQGTMSDAGAMGHGQDYDEDEYLHQGRALRNYKIFPGRNVFFCHGRIMTSRDFPAFVIALFMLLTPTGLFHGFTSPYLWHRLSPAAPIVQAYLFIVAFSSMLKTSWTDPGVIPRGIDGDPPLDPPLEPDAHSASFYPLSGLPRVKEVQVGVYTIRLKYCDTCKIYRPPRCSHCRQCDNCVGRRNYRYFLIFVSTASVYAFLTAALCLTHLLLLFHDSQRSMPERADQVSFSSDAMAKAPVSTLVMVYATVMGLAVGSLASYHLWLATMNRTTHEQLSASMMRPYVVDNPFDRGTILGNCAAVLCRPPTRSYIRRRDYVVA
ncbi:Palmitoyltransferase zdhhc14 [Podila epigama]|nr:Palmitoyltransferase zdhhc14 [Podila epigama]